jgi:acyl-CoA thioester hydrolase
VTYEVGIFMENDTQAAAHGELVHVFVDRATQSSTPIPPGIREALERITV